MSIEGATVGSYRVTRKLGEGGMGAVYVGEHTLLGRKAAIKMLLPALSAHQEIVQRFFNEAKAVTQIADPGIVQVFDFGHHTDGSAYIVMELLDGEPMDKRLARIHAFAPADALRLLKQAASSLGAAHAKGIVHRDLKPENLYIVGDPAVTGGERVKILDFGIAKLSGDEPGKLKTRTGTLIGTPVYMSPEQCRGAGDIDHRSDIYSLGCVFFCMLTGRPPFEGDGSGELIVAHLREPPPRASSRVPGMPPIIDDVILRCMAKAPAERFQTMAELGQALAAAEATIYGYAPHGGSGHYLAQPTPPPYAGGATPPPYAGGATPPPYGAPGVRTPPPYQPYPGAGGTGQGVAGAGGPTPPPAPATASQVTTLGSSSGQTPTGVAPARGPGRWVIVGALVAAAGGAGAFVATRSGGSSSGSAAASGSGTASGSGSQAAVGGAVDAGARAELPVTPDAPQAAAAGTVDASVAAATTTIDAAQAAATAPPDAAPQAAAGGHGGHGSHGGHGNSAGSGAQTTHGTATSGGNDHAVQNGSGSNQGSAVDRGD